MVRRDEVVVFRPLYILLRWLAVVGRRIWRSVLGLLQPSTVRGCLCLVKRSLMLRKSQTPMDWLRVFWAVPFLLGWPQLPGRVWVALLSI